MFKGLGNMEIKKFVDRFDKLGKDMIPTIAKKQATHSGTSWTRSRNNKQQQEENLQYPL